ncbi:hypothetical protein [Orenia marismortui]|uniref:Uncharacterized protein n=1 Tax=Orenia marismortui TaxID=46469 RepID=A0A4R8HR92_9FIRM|nr:hypothetical protein [Orenia marismortui]TDX59017.1 hypothetical protein C7959_102155 [Orenia marismortui]
MKQMYCYKCDIYYSIPEGNKKINNCPFCSLEDVKYDNLTIIDKLKIKGLAEKDLDTRR